MRIIHRIQTFFPFVYINLWPKIYLILCFSLGNLINHITQHVIWIDFSQFDVNVLFNLCAKDWLISQCQFNTSRREKNIVKKEVEVKKDDKKILYTTACVLHDKCVKNVLLRMKIIDRNSQINMTNKMLTFIIRLHYFKDLYQV